MRRSQGERAAKMAALHTAATSAAAPATGKMPVAPVCRQDGGKGGYSVSSESGSGRKGTMPMKVMPLRSVQGFS